jgi:hypothetical protein
MKKALVIITVAFLFCSTLIAQGDNESSRKSLKGLTGVWVEVTPLDPDVERGGLSKDQIQTDVGLRLRMAGLKVLTREQMLVTPGMPSLEVELGTFKGNQSPIQEIYSYSLNVSLDQIVNLTRDPQVSVDASTWWTAKVGLWGRPN